MWKWLVFLGIIASAPITEGWVTRSQRHRAEKACQCKCLVYWTAERYLPALPPSEAVLFTAPDHLVLCGLDHPIAKGRAKEIQQLVNEREKESIWNR